MEEAVQYTIEVTTKVTKDMSVVKAISNESDGGKYIG